MKKKFLLIILCVLILGVIYFISPFFVGEVSTSKLRQVFSQQSNLFTQPIASLGVIGQPSTMFMCVDDVHTHWQTELTCQDYANYPYNQSSISLAAKNDYAINAAKFDALLKQNGWVNDRPSDSITNLVDNNPYLSQNNGIGGGVPFHKNIGSISCNLEVDFDSLLLSDSAAPGSININEFSCRQTVKFFMPHLTNWQAPGP